MKKILFALLAAFAVAGYALASDLNDNLRTNATTGMYAGTDQAEIVDRFVDAAADIVALEGYVNDGALAIDSLTDSGTVESIELYGQSLTRSGSDLYWAGNKLTN